MNRTDTLLYQIERTLAECDARRLPPLTSGPAAAVLDLVEQAGLTLEPWQEFMVRSMYATDPVGGLAMRYTPATPAKVDRSVLAQLRDRQAGQPPRAWSPQGAAVDWVIEVAAPRRRRWSRWNPGGPVPKAVARGPWWRRWWSR